jgi:uncharacterized membrane protein YbhN (UPF0104 family)
MVVERRYRGWFALVAVVLVAASAFLLIPSLASVPMRLGTGCGRWLALAVVFALLSAVGFVVVFKLSFGGGMGWGRSSRIGLCVLGASTVLPAGGLIGPVVGAWVTRVHRRGTGTRALAFVLLTNAPNVAVLGVLGIAVSVGWIPGPRAPELTIVPAAAALALFVAIVSLPRWLHPDAARRPRGFGSRMTRLAGGLGAAVHEAEALIGGHNWKLLGALAYYAFDNAVLWAAFRAFGHSPSLGVVGIAYLIGAVGGALPLPAGIGGVEAGLIGTLVVYGVPAAPAAAAVLVYRGITLAVPVVLGVAAYVQPRAGLAFSAVGRAAAPERVVPSPTACSTCSSRGRTPRTRSSAG